MLEREAELFFKPPMGVKMHPGIEVSVPLDR